MFRRDGGHLQARGRSCCGWRTVHPEGGVRLAFRLDLLHALWHSRGLICIRLTGRCATAALLVTVCHGEHRSLQRPMHHMSSLSAFERRAACPETTRRQQVQLPPVSPLFHLPDVAFFSTTASRQAAPPVFRSRPREVSRRRGADRGPLQSPFSGNVCIALVTWANGISLGAGRDRSGGRFSNHHRSAGPETVARPNIGSRGVQTDAEPRPLLRGS